MDKLDSMKERFSKFAKERDWEKYHNPKDLAMKISIEASELLEKFEWKTQEESFQVVKDKEEEVASEMADVLAMLLELSNITGIDLYEAFNKKMDLNDKRYPKELVKGKSHKYTYYQK
jgi:dCTP diphosphatase